MGLGTKTGTGVGDPVLVPNPDFFWDLKSYIHIIVHTKFQVDQLFRSQDIDGTEFRRDGRTESESKLALLKF